MDEYRFLVDEDLSPKVADALGGYGFDATSVQEAIGKGANDRAVCRFAEREGFVLVTNDDDFLQKPLLGRVPVLFVNNEYSRNPSRLSNWSARWSGTSPTRTSSPSFSTCQTSPTSGFPRHTSVTPPPGDGGGQPPTFRQPLPLAR